MNSWNTCSFAKKKYWQLLLAILLTDSFILTGAVGIWAVLAPGISVAIVHHDSSIQASKYLTLIDPEFRHEFDAFALWWAILIGAGLLIALANIRIIPRGGVYGLIGSCCIMFIGSIVGQKYANSIAFAWMKYRPDPLIKTLPPHPEMGFMDSLLTHVPHNLSTFIFGKSHYDLTQFTPHLLIPFIGIFGVAIGYAFYAFKTLSQISD